MSENICPICQNDLSLAYNPWHFRCNACRYEKGKLKSSINSFTPHQSIDEGVRQTGLRKLRQRNFEDLLLKIKLLKPNGGRLLDVGCAHGWFLETAKDDFDVLGLEPDKSVFGATVQRALPVRSGYFPDALYDAEKFDVIVFNDVFEHIPDIERVLAFCHQHLHKGGLLVINLPSSNGAFYRLSKILCRLGFPSFFERMWQKDLPSPHVHYFNPPNLVDLLHKAGFDVKMKGELSTICLDGLYARVSYIKHIKLAMRLFVYLTVSLGLPLLRLLPSDIFFVVSVPRQ